MGRRALQFCSARYDPAPRDQSARYEVSVKEADVAVPRGSQLIRDRDTIYDAAVTRRFRAMGIRDKPIAPGALTELLC
jgi:hypothetical protein